MNKQGLALAALFAVNLIYAINYLVVKGVSPTYIGPSGFILLRASFAMLLFWIVGFFRPKEQIEKKDWGRIILAGFFGVAANQLMFFHGLVLTTPVNASIIMTSNPIFVLIVATLLIGERLTTRKIVGIITGFIGAFLLVSLQESTKTASNPFLGNLLVLMNALSYGMYLVIVKPIMGKYSPLTVIKWVFTIGFIFVIPFGFTDVLAMNTDMPPAILGSIFYVLVFTTFLAYLFNIFALKRVAASVVSSFIYLQPIITAIIAAIIGVEQMTMLKLGAGLIIFLGVYLVSFQAKK